MTYLLTHSGVVIARLGEHIVLTGIALVIALVIAFPLGVLVVRRPRIGAPILAVLGALYTVPSLALLALLVAVMGLGAPTAIVALVLYAQMILVRNIAAGLQALPPAVLDAADGLGFTMLGRLWRIELPLALPTILGGVRIATISLIAIATVAAWIDAGGLGTLVFAGLHQDDPQKIVAGSIAAIALALAADGALRLVSRVTARYERR